MYSVARKSAHILRMSLVMAAAMLATCVLALAETAHTAEAEDSLPENGKIVFTRNSRIYTVEPDGSNLSKLTNSTYVASKPVWSPDGTEIAFGRQGINSTDVSISIISADGSDLSDPYTGANYNPGSTWSPDGTKLAFGSFGVSQDSNPSNDIYMMYADGSNLVNVTKSPRFNENDPDFSPNGAQMCFSQVPTGVKPGTGIYIMDSDGSGPKPLVKVSGENSSGERCHWSPDGAKIAFHAVIPDSEGGDYRKAVKKAINEGNVQKALEIGKAARDEEVYVINTDGSGRTALTNNAAADVNPHWSPDGRKITFASDRDGTFDICTMDADGSDVAQVTNARNDYLNPPDPDWQPLQEPTPPKDADDPDEAQGTKKPAVEDVDRDRPERTVIVKPGDSLWSISEQRLGPEASPQRVYDHTYQMYALNRKRIGSDPDLIFAGQRLWLPPLGEG